MIFEIIKWIYTIYAIIVTIYIFAWNISRVLHSFKNRPKDKYENIETFIKYYFDKYYDDATDTDVLTEEDLQLKYEIIEKLEMQKNAQQKTE